MHCESPALVCPVAPDTQHMPREPITQPVYPDDEAADQLQAARMEAAQATLRAVLDWLAEPVVEPKASPKKAARRAGMRVVVLHHYLYPGAPRGGDPLEAMAATYGVTKQAMHKLVVRCRNHFGLGHWLAGRALPPVSTPRPQARPIYVEASKGTPADDMPLFTAAVRVARVRPKKERVKEINGGKQMALDAEACPPGRNLLQTKEATQVKTLAEDGQP